MFRPHKIKWSDYRSKIVPDAKKQPIRHSQMERLPLSPTLPSLSPFCTEYEAGGSRRRHALLCEVCVDVVSRVEKDCKS